MALAPSIFMVNDICTFIIIYLFRIYGFLIRIRLLISYASNILRFQCSYPAIFSLSTTIYILKLSIWSSNLVKNFIVSSLRIKIKDWFLCASFGSSLFNLGLNISRKGNVINVLIAPQEIFSWIISKPQDKYRERERDRVRDLERERKRKSNCTWMQTEFHEQLLNES